MTLIWVHGWAYDHTYFEPIIRLLPNHRHIRVNLGYYGDPLQTDLSELDARQDCIAIAHSFGLMWLLTQQPILFKKYISINGFSRLAWAPDLTEGVSVSSLQIMINQFKVNSGSVLQSFYRQCGVRPSFDCSPNLDRLSQDLDLMATADLRGRFKSVQNRIHAFMSEKDGIVPMALQNALFTHKTILPNEKHSPSDLSFIETALLKL